MASYYWIKLYHEILDDPKMGLMDAELFSFTIKLFLVAGETDKEGELPPAKHIAWRLHISEVECNEKLHELKRNGIAECNEDETKWTVTNFSNRQNPVPVKERVRQFRKRQTEQEEKPEEKPENKPDDSSDNDVTKSYIDKDIDTDNINITTTTPAQELLNYFCQKTNRQPRGIVDNQAWEDDCADILAKAKGDVTRAKGLTDEAMVILDGLGYTYKTPAGLLATIDNLLKPKAQRNGVNGNGHTARNKQTESRLKGRRTGEDLAAEPYYDPATREHVFPDGRREPAA